MQYIVKTGSEFHSTERRGCMVTVNGKPIYQVLKPITVEWELIGNKGRHGKWCTAHYEIPIGSRVVFEATANNKLTIREEFTVNAELNINFEGYMYSTRVCGSISSAN